jgi:hypothetical protein
MLYLWLIIYRDTSRLKGRARQVGLPMHVPNSVVPVGPLRQTIVAKHLASSRVVCVRDHSTVHCIRLWLVCPPAFALHCIRRSMCSPPSSIRFPDTRHTTTCVCVRLPDTAHDRSSRATFPKSRNLGSGGCYRSLAPSGVVPLLGRPRGRVYYILGTGPGSHTHTFDIVTRCARLVLQV